jgi:hypothetical protein
MTDHRYYDEAGYRVPDYPTLKDIFTDFDARRAAYQAGKLNGFLAVSFFVVIGLIGLAIFFIGEDLVKIAGLAVTICSVLGGFLVMDAVRAIKILE